MDGTHWKLTGWTLSSLNPADFTITANFDGGKISGRSGVNSYSGSYTLGSDRAFAVGDVVSTEMGGPPLAMRAEHAYVTLLQQARFYETAGNRLTLFDGGGNTSLIFDAASG